MARLLVVLLLLGFLGGWHWWRTERPVHHRPGIIALNDPKQIDLDTPEIFSAKGYTFSKRARFDITARLVHKSYYRADAGAALAPVDLVVGWGPLSDSAVLDKVEFSQMGRWFYWRPKTGEFPLTRETMITHLAQMHMIPASEEVEAQLDTIRPGSLLTVRGFLVDVRGPNGFTWNTSTTRDDTGDGSCEIVWAQEVQVD